MRAPLLALLACLLLCGPAVGQAGARFAVRATPADGWRPAVRVQGLLGDAALRGALDSGLPLRLHLRIELWQKQLLDRLVDAQEISVALVQDPLDREYVLDLRRSQQRFSSLAAVTGALELALRPEIHPTGSGRFYYLATLEVESLSLTDLEELRRWLRGEVAPAFQGKRAPERAVGTGVRRLLVRVLGLPTRSFEARTGTFTIR